MSSVPVMPRADIPLEVDATGSPTLDDLLERAEPHISQHLHVEGAILLRTRCVASVGDFEHFVTSLNPNLLSYDFASTPRHALKGRIYTSTEYPPQFSIALHNEMSYTRQWPQCIWFFCEQAAQSGGETPLADSRSIYRRIDPALRRRFEADGLLYVRNYRPGLDISWQQTFNTQHKAAVAAYCDRAGIEHRWNGDELKTWQKCQASVRHPRTGEMVWFNQAHVFHVSGLAAPYREALREMFGPDELPRNVLYGDGKPIEDAEIEQIRAVLAEEKRIFQWRHGDVLMLDNLLVAHGREPFTGPRSIAVAMA